MAMGSTRQFVTFIMGDELYGIDIHNTQEINRIQEVTPIPNALEYVEGIINLRGDIIPIINLEKKFRMVASAQDKKEIIIIKTHGTKIGVIVNKVFRVIQAEERDVSPPPSILSGIEEEYIQGVTHIEGEKLVILLDIEKMFFEEELKSLQTIGEE